MSQTPTVTPDLDKDNEIVTGHSNSQSHDESLSSETIKNLALSASGLNPQKENDSQPEDTKLVDDQFLYSSSKTRSFFDSNNPLFRIISALVLTGTLGISVIFLWSFWGKVTGGGNNVVENQPSTQPRPVSNSPPDVDSEDNLKAELALIDQEKAKLRLKELKKEEPEPETVKPKPRPPRSRPSPQPQPQSTAQPEVETINPLDEWASLSQLGASWGDSLLAQEQLIAESSPQIDSRLNQQNESQLASSPSQSNEQLRTANNPNSVPQTKSLDTQDEIAKIASVTIGAGQLSQPYTEQSNLQDTPGTKEILLSGYNYTSPPPYVPQQQQETSSSNEDHPLEASEVRSPSNEDESAFSSRQAEDIERIETLDNNGTTSNTTVKSVPLGTTVSGLVTTPIVWSEDLESHRTRATITLDEPLQTREGQIALPTGSNLIVEVAYVASNGLATLDAIAVSYINSQGKFVQQQIPDSTFIIHGENSEPLIAEAIGDNGGTSLSQDVLLGVLGAGERGFEVLNQPDQQTTVSSDDFVSTSTSNDASLVNGALEGAFSVTKERLEERSDTITSEAAARTKIYQIKPDTLVSIYVNSFLELD